MTGVGRLTVTAHGETLVQRCIRHDRESLPGLLAGLAQFGRVQYVPPGVEPPPSDDLAALLDQHNVGGAE